MSLFYINLRERSTVSLIQTLGPTLGGYSGRTVWTAPFTTGRA